MPVYYSVFRPLYKAYTMIVCTSKHIRATGRTGVYPFGGLARTPEGWVFLSPVLSRRLLAHFTFPSGRERRTAVWSYVTHSGEIREKDDDSPFSALRQ